MSIGSLLLLVAILRSGSAATLSHSEAAHRLPVADPVIDERIAKSRLALAFNYPGAGLRYFLIDRWAVELGAQYAGGTSSALVAGGRLARYFDGRAGLFPYLGAEVDFVNYKDSAIAGIGYMGAAFLGVEWFLHNRVSIQVDAGPALTRLTSTPASITNQGMDIVVNAGLTLYLTSVSRSTPHP